MLNSPPAHAICFYILVPCLVPRPDHFLLLLLLPPPAPPAPPLILLSSFSHPPPPPLSACARTHIQYMAYGTAYDRHNRQVSLECGQPFPSADYDAFSITGTFESGEVRPDPAGRSQLNLYVCAPHGNYEIDMVIFGDFAAQEGKRIGWEIEDGETQVRYIRQKRVQYTLT